MLPRCSPVPGPPTTVFPRCSPVPGRPLTPPHDRCRRGVEHKWARVEAHASSCSGGSPRRHSLSITGRASPGHSPLHQYLSVLHFPFEVEFLNSQIHLVGVGVKSVALSVSIACSFVAEVAARLLVAALAPSSAPWCSRPRTRLTMFIMKSLNITKRERGNGLVSTSAACPSPVIPRARIAPDL